MAMTSRLVFLIAVLVASSCTTEAMKKKKVTNIQFYMHDIVSGPNPTAVKVAGQLTNSTSSNWIASTFGSIYVIDDPLTATPQMNSTLMGRAQGIYAMASQQDEFSLLMTITYAFISGRYNGSSFSVVGRNPVMNEVREMPIVGGTGVFRLASGYCLAHTYSTNEMDAVIGYNATLIHY